MNQLPLLQRYFRKEPPIDIDDLYHRTRKIMRYAITAQRISALAQYNNYCQLFELAPTVEELKMMHQAMSTSNRTLHIEMNPQVGMINQNCDKWSLPLNQPTVNEWVRMVGRELYKAQHPKMDIIDKPMI